jgi:plasmid rolling circle replication initiator protein Rep
MIDNQAKNKLNDIRKNGKIFDWDKYKLKNSELSYILSELGVKNKSERVYSCGYFLKFINAINGDWQGLKLIEARFCMHKLCPLCNKRRADKHAFQVRKILTISRERKPKARFLFLTLTAKNVYDGNELDEAIKHMHKSYARLFDRTKVKKNVIGAMRVTEITVNKQNGSYNQHIHVLLMVKPNYFSSYDDNYISQSEWTSMWKESLQVDYTPIVNIKVVKPSKKSKHENDMMGVVYEVAKYPVKDSDYLTQSLEENKQRVYELDIGLFRKRQIAYLGLLKDIKKELGLQDVEDDKADLVSEEDTANIDELSEHIVFAWNEHRKGYYKI